MSRADLKAACLEFLNTRATEHPSGHQSKLAARYLLRTDSGALIELMFEKHPATPAHLWVAHRWARTISVACSKIKLYPRSPSDDLSGLSRSAQYGRHSALKAMGELANEDLARVTLGCVSDLEALISDLLKSA